MAIMFTELVKTSVHIGLGDGKYIVVPMLPVVDFSEYQKLQYDLAQLNEKPETTQMQRIDAIVVARGKLAEMAKKVMPVELHERLQLMDYPTLSALVLVLCKGSDDSEKDDPSKKVTLPSQLAQAGQQ